MISEGNFIICADEGEYAVYEVMSFDGEDIGVELIDQTDDDVSFTHLGYTDCRADEFISYDDENIVGIYHDKAELERSLEPIRTAHAAKKKAIQEATRALDIARARHRNATEKAEASFSVMVKLCQQRIEIDE